MKQGGTSTVMCSDSMRNDLSNVSDLAIHATLQLLRKNKKMSWIIRDIQCVVVCYMHIKGAFHSFTVENAVP